MRTDEPRGSSGGGGRPLGRKCRRRPVAKNCWQHPIPLCCSEGTSLCEWLRNLSATCTDLPLSPQCISEPQPGWLTTFRGSGFLHALWWLCVATPLGSVFLFIPSLNPISSATLNSLLLFFYYILIGAAWGQNEVGLTKWIVHIDSLSLLFNLGRGSILVGFFLNSLGKGPGRASFSPAPPYDIDPLRR